MSADAAAVVPRTRGRVEVVRSRAQRAMLGPAFPMPYLLATWQGGHRPVMVAVALLMLGVAAVTWWRAEWVARATVRSIIQAALMLVNIVGSACLTLLDGGVASPIGALLPFSLLFYAVMMPPRLFFAAAVLTWIAYWTVAVLGDPAPPGYAVVYTLGVGSASYICLRHATALVSMRRRLVMASRLDPLTQCLNRRGLDERMEHELAEADRTGKPVMLVMTDLDRFKEVNDTYGHQAGDSLLAWTARTMRRTLRPDDAVGRLGGDEFAAVLPGLGPDVGPAVVRRLRAALEGTASASFGHACYPAEADGLEQLRQLADQRAYADKASRDRQLPDPMVMSRLGRPGGPDAARTVPRRERSGRSIIALGQGVASESVVGVLYAAVFAAGEHHRVVIGVLCALGAVYGMTVVALADRILHFRFRRQFILASALVVFCYGWGVPVLNGGVASVTALGLLLPMPLIALAAPMRVAGPILAAVSGAYLCAGVVLGAPSGWYVGMHLAGFLIIAVVCARQGRTAADRRRQLTLLSRTDALTGCLNRRGFEEGFSAELGRTSDADGPVGLLIFDLDEFKQLNDSSGHAAGDDLLRWVADTLRANLSEGEPLGRLGGDEFVVAVRARSVGDVSTTAELLRTALATRTSASVGSAVLGPDGADFETLYTHADAALYSDKRTRRGRRRSPAPPSTTSPADRSPLSPSLP